MIVFGVTYLVAAVFAVFAIGIYRPSKIFLAVTEVGDEVICAVVKLWILQVSTMVEESTISGAYFFEFLFFLGVDFLAFFFG